MEQEQNSSCHNVDPRTVTSEESQECEDEQGVETIVIKSEPVIPDYYGSEEEDQLYDEIEISRLCHLCHKSYSFDTQHRGNGRLSFFKQFILKEILKSKSIKDNNGFLAQFPNHLPFCDDCSIKIDTLQKLYKQLLAIQKQFGILKNEFVEEFLNAYENSDLRSRTDIDIVTPPECAKRNLERTSSKRALAAIDAILQYDEEGSDGYDEGGSDYEMEVSPTDFPNDSHMTDQAEINSLSRIGSSIGPMNTIDSICQVRIERLKPVDSEALAGRNVPDLIRNPAHTLQLGDGFKYKCEACPKRFTNIRSLIVHTRTHAEIKPYKCKSCDKRFFNARNLRRHLVVHTKERNHKCEDCGKGFSRRDKLRRHLTNVHQKNLEKSYLCEFCPSRRFFYPSELYKHKETCQGNPSNPSHKKQPSARKRVKKVTTTDKQIIVPAPASKTCSICGKTFSRADIVKRHLAKVHDQIENPVLCDLCPEKFPFVSDLSKHKHLRHGEPASIPSTSSSQKSTAKKVDYSNKTCEDCELTFDSYSLLQAHCLKESHGKGGGQNQCEFCGNSFSTKKSLRLHINHIHKGIKRFACTKCDESYTTKHGLDRHFVKHTGKPLMNCTHCEESFNYIFNLRKHLVQAHPEQHLISKTKFCPACWKLYETESELEQHLSERHFKCKSPGCGKLFSCAKSYLQHELIHTGEKPFQCTQCGKAFNCKGNLTEHMLRHTGEKRFKCSQCDQGFFRQKVLDLHMAKSHPLSLPAGSQQRNEENSGINYTCQSNSHSQVIFHQPFLGQQQHAVPLNTHVETLYNRRFI